MRLSRLFAPDALNDTPLRWFLNRVSAGLNRFGGHTFALDGDQSIAEIGVDIAFYVQDDLTYEVWAAWPQCPGHPHPMSPAIVGEAAVWECPSGADVAMPIGQLGAGPLASR